MKQQPDYGLDAPAVIRNLVIAAVLVPFFYKVFFAYLNVRFPSFLFTFLSSWIWFGIIFASFILPALFMYLSSRYGKHRLRDQMITGLRLKGNERVLDVGCGRGLMLVGIAKKLTTGRAVGIDTWDEADLSGNSLQAAQENATLEQVEQRVEIITGNACRLPFEDNLFDIVVSNLVLHNIDGQLARERALQEIVRVLKPGGEVLISDFLYTNEYSRVLKRAGLKNVKRTGLQLLIFPPVRLVTGLKKAKA
ncbi:MAG: class I SAM-dependent methyltransferase [Epsilonproteobacteria bacterium]|nr:class I SAM-dependent methyltransferase [Campylobacterota bacterium]